VDETNHSRNRYALAEEQCLHLQETRLPLPVQRLPRREREVAVVVYRGGAMTANEVMSRLSWSVGNGAVRSMLNRLVAKQILARCQPTVGKALRYSAALTCHVALEGAFKRLADEYFDGSTTRALESMIELFGHSTLGSPIRLRRAAVR
jgi:predicted transcriptional regulator